MRSTPELPRLPRYSPPDFVMKSIVYPHTGQNNYGGPPIAKSNENLNANIHTYFTPTPPTYISTPYLDDDDKIYNNINNIHIIITGYIKGYNGGYNAGYGGI